MTAVFKSSSIGETRALGRALGEVLAPGDCLGLSGDLGAGKTLLVQAIAVGLEIPSSVRVTSPTFTLVNVYRGGRLELAHADLYRIERALELPELGLDELLGGPGVLAIEWADRFPVAPVDALRLAIAVTGEGSRRLTASTGGADSEALLERWTARVPGLSESGRSPRA